jgi:hypothetical protein
MHTYALKSDGAQAHRRVGRTNVVCSTDADDPRSRYATKKYGGLSFSAWNSELVF